MCIRDRSDGFCKFYIYRNGAEGSYHTSRPSRITHGLADSKTVSYTHLDVYKRQIHSRQIPDNPLRNQEIDAAGNPQKEDYQGKQEYHGLLKSSGVIQGIIK